MAVGERLSSSSLRSSSLSRSKEETAGIQHDWQQSDSQASDEITSAQ